MNAQVQLVYEFGPFRADPVKRQLFENGHPVPLSPKALDLLIVLIQHGGEVVAREELMKAVWPESVVEENSLARSISVLRKALGEKTDEHRYVVTVPGRGYSFVAPVREMPANGLPDAGSLRRGWTRPLGTVLSAAFALAAAVALLLSYLAKRDPVPFQNAGLTRLTSTGNSSRATISPDGKYVAHVVGDAGQQSLRVRMVATESEVELAPPSRVAYGGLTFSNDSNHIYYGVQMAGEPKVTLYKIPVLGGKPDRVLVGLDSPVSFSPDGKQFAFVRENAASGESALLTAAVSGAPERKIASRRLPEFLDYPAWSPSGRIIACTAVSPSIGSVRVIQVGLDDGTEKPVTSETWGYIRQLKWLGGGSSIVLSARDRISGVFSIWSVSFPGGEVRRITQNLESLIGVSVTADSRTLATVREKLLSSLWVGPYDEPGRLRQVVHGASKYSRANWTRDGRILYEKEAGDGRQIWVMDPATNQTRQLTFEGSNYNPSACGDGRLIVHLSVRGGGYEIRRMDTDGANSRVISAESGEVFPRCSPDSRWVVYASARGGKWPVLWKLPIDGGAPLRLNEQFARQPAISPDGTQIAYLRAREGANIQAEVGAVAVISMAGGRPLRVFEIPQTVYEPAGLRWAPGGNALTYVDNRNGVSNIWSQPIGGGAPRRLTDFGGDRIFFFDWSPDGRIVCLSRGTLTHDVILIRDAG